MQSGASGTSGISPDLFYDWATYNSFPSRSIVMMNWAYLVLIAGWFGDEATSLHNVIAVVCELATVLKLLERRWTM
jgi:hypothetical protein